MSPTREIIMTRLCEKHDEEPHLVCPICLHEEVKRLKYIIASLKLTLSTAYKSAQIVEDNVRIENGKVQVWCLGEWMGLEVDEEAAGK